MALQKILVDTDVLIDFLRKKEKAKALLEKASTAGDLYISVINLAEILAGMKPHEKEKTEAFISGFNLIEINEAIARHAGGLRNQYKQIGLADCLIAATALKEDCLLLTFNYKDYPFEKLRFAN